MEPPWKETWPKLGWIQSLRIAQQLRQDIRKLRSTTSSAARSPVPGKCTSFWLDGHSGSPPRASPAELASHISFWITSVDPQTATDAVEVQLPAALSKKYVPSAAAPLVFTHHDLAPRNILLDRSDCLWLIDWDFAGWWYPRYFEYAGMHNILPEHWTRVARMRWNLATWIAAGYWEKEKGVLQKIRYKISRFRTDCRSHVLKFGSPSRLSTA